MRGCGEERARDGAGLRVPHSLWHGATSADYDSPSWHPLETGSDPTIPAAQMTAQIASTSALYYPWMHFQNDDWLKIALLTWDRIVRVRPRDLEDRDDELVKQVRADTPYLIEIVPSTTDLELVTSSFEDVLSRY